MDGVAAAERRLCDAVGGVEEAISAERSRRQRQRQRQPGAGTMQQQEGQQQDDQRQQTQQQQQQQQQQRQEVDQLLVLLREALAAQRASKAAAAGEPEAAARAALREAAVVALRHSVDASVTALGGSIDRSRSMLDAHGSAHGCAHAGVASLPSPEAILAYAHRLRYTTFAHAGLVSQPPCPQQAQMLNSTLFTYARARAADAVPCTLTESRAATAGVQPGTAAAADAAAQEAVAAALPDIDLSQIPEMPSGWKPGDPIATFPQGFQLPADIPEMPAGWKPGDPLPFPRPAAGTAAEPAAARTEPGPVMAEPATEAGAGAAPPAAPDAQAKVRQEWLPSFILNPDLEDDYSSSEEEEDDDDF